VQLWKLSSEGDRPECLWQASAGGIVKLNKPIVAFSPSGAWVATGKPMSRSFRLLRAADGTEAGGIDWAIVDGAGPYELAFAPDNDAVAVSYDNIDFFPLSDAGLGPRITRLKAGYWTSFGSLAFSPEGKRLAAAGGKALFLWRRGDWSQEGKIPVQGDIAGLAWSPTTPHLIALAVGSIARLVEVSSGHEVRDFRHDAKVIGVAFSPDGALLATASVDHSARVFDVRDGGEVARISRPAAVTAVAFASDGRLAIGDAANRVQLWTPS
jgi:WD40 repeat protein